MSAPQPGWYADPVDGRRRRWWNGIDWTDQISEHGRQRTSPLPAPRLGRRVPVWMWVVMGLIVVPILVVLWPLLGAVASVVVVTGVVALATRSRTWLRFPSSGAALATTAVATVVVLATGGLTAVALTSVSTSVAVAEPAPVAQPVEGTQSSTTAAPQQKAPAASLSKPPSASPTPKSTRTTAPSPTPVVRVVDVSVSSVIPFDRASIDDGTLPRGQSRIDVAGVDGERVSVFRVTTVDGVETGRTLLTESISRLAVSEITAVGTYDAPPPAPEPPAPEPPAAEPPASDGCHPSYADACVPVDSDVDCAGGSGNGPSYFDGVARVVGPDEYDLDRDGDGWACNG